MLSGSCTAYRPQRESVLFPGLLYSRMFPGGRIRENGFRIPDFNPLGSAVKKRMDFLIYTTARPPGYFRSAPHGNCELNFYSFVLAGISKHKHVVVIPARARKFTVLIMGS